MLSFPLLAVRYSKQRKTGQGAMHGNKATTGYFLTVPLFLPSPHTGAPANADKDVDSKVLLVFGADRGWIVAHVLPQVAPSVSKAGILRGRRTVPMGSLLEQF